MKRTIPLVLVASISACATSHPRQQEQDLPQRPGFVSDFADKLSFETKRELETKLREFADRSGIELAVATIPYDDMHGKPIEEYSLNLGREWGIESSYAAEVRYARR